MKDQISYSKFRVLDIYFILYLQSCIVMYGYTLMKYAFLTWMAL